jgi:hypothetical protein
MSSAVDHCERTAYLITKVDADVAFIALEAIAGRRTLVAVVALYALTSGGGVGVLHAKVLVVFVVIKQHERTVDVVKCWTLMT